MPIPKRIERRSLHFAQVSDCKEFLTCAIVPDDSADTRKLSLTIPGRTSGKKWQVGNEFSRSRRTDSTGGKVE